MIEARNLTKWYGRVLAVDDVSFEVPKGAIVGFLGPNGAGKSTTLKMLTCYLPSSSGTAKVAGYDILSESMEVRRRIGYMPEAVPLYPEMRVGEYLSFRASLRDIPRRQRAAAVERVAQRCWLSAPENMMRRRLGELSRGYKQRVGLAEVMLHNPPVLILDEPTTGLDPAQIRSMRELIRGLAPEHTVIFSSHILAEVEQTCTQLIIIASGKVVAQGTAAELRQRVSGPSRVVAELKGVSEADLLKAVKSLPAVRSASSSPGSWTRVHVEAQSDADVRGDLYQLATRNGWQLRELRRESGSLEDYFVQITYEQNMRQGQQA
jgi:ABC-2 type transport system ATP-binding protein